MRRVMPTANTTVLPTDDSPTNQKGLALCEAIKRQRRSIAAVCIYRENRESRSQAGAPPAQRTAYGTDWSPPDIPLPVRLSDRVGAPIRLLPHWRSNDAVQNVFAIIAKYRPFAGSEHNVTDVAANEIDA